MNKGVPLPRIPKGRGFPAPDQAVKLKNLTATPLGADILLEGEVE